MRLVYSTGKLTINLIDIFGLASISLLYKIKVSGKVQGVYYRQYTKEFALNIGIKGWVKNQIDGTVLIHAEGSEDQLKQLLGWCQQGSPLSIVENVELLEVSKCMGYDTFFIEK